MQQIIMYSLFVGNYKSPSITKGDVSKLNNLGLRGFVFSRGDHYSLKVYSSPSYENIKTVKEKLEQNGFQVEVDEINLTKNLHI